MQRANAGEPSSLLRFVNKWGVLGIGIPKSPEFSFDGVVATGKWVSELQRWIEAFHALRHGKDPGETWDDLAVMLRGCLTHVHPDVRPVGGRLRQSWKLSTLLTT